MRRSFCVLLLNAIILSVILPSFAQQRAIIPSRSTESPLPSVPPKQRAAVKPIQPAARVSTQFRSVKAFSDGRNVWIKWQMAVETQNFGFDVYAVDGTSRRKLNDAPILGGATKLANRPLFSGQYEFLTSGKEANSQFVIQTFPMAGSAVVSNAFSAAKVTDLNSLSGFASRRLLAKNLSGTGKIEKTSLTPESDLQSEITQSLQSPDPDMQKWVAAQPGVKYRHQGRGHLPGIKSSASNGWF